MWTTLVSEETCFPAIQLAKSEEEGILIEIINLGNLIIFLCKNQLKYLDIHKKIYGTRPMGMWESVSVGCGITDTIEKGETDEVQWQISPTFSLSF